ncbi:DNA cytosine methyltransferase [Nocardioides acrostichi]|uniref:Cytosine-specific methyltransferase n=1 Tax=Nocardioides acrostichi TaxID=2784339 RepID=A0A930Y7J6_9ACTN|nr:DNA cytosine methyltransferase [Nocardioides acrostichi]MBF4163490.1 DNA cytosine methyltransferase [Nocardioides acrostichi]
MVSLFTGAGGLDTGLDATGEFDLLGCVEIESRYCESLRVNRAAGRFGSPSTEIIEADLSVLDPVVLMEKLGIEPGEVDVLVGGPPCQAFSTAGRRKSVADPRGTLVWDFLRFVEALQPTMFVMENVRGLLSAALQHRPIAERPPHGPPLTRAELPGSVMRLWAHDLARLEGGYRADCFEVNAVNYGAPQLRERALVIGNRLGKVVDFPEPTHGPGTDRPFGTLGEALAGVVEAPAERVLMDFSPRKKAYLELVTPGGNWRTLPPAVAQESMGRAFHAKGGRSGWWRRLSRDLPCPTITTMPNHSSTSMCHPDEVRVLSVAECLAVQEFPADWQVTGSPQEQYAQVGNAVPARLGRVAGELVAAELRSPEAHVVADAEPFRRVYLRSHVRTRRWYGSGEGAVVWPPSAASS